MNWRFIFYMVFLFTKMLRSGQKMLNCLLKIATKLGFNASEPAWDISGTLAPNFTQIRNVALLFRRDRDNSSVRTCTRSVSTSCSSTSRSAAPAATCVAMASRDVRRIYWCSTVTTVAWPGVYWRNYRKQINQGLYRRLYCRWLPIDRTALCLGDWAGDGWLGLMQACDLTSRTALC